MSVDRALAALHAGQLVCFPTETTYGLAVDIRHPDGLDRLVALKGRDPAAPFALIAADVDQARRLAERWPARAEELATRYWPGPLTLVVTGRAGLPAEIVAADGGVGVRVSSHPVASELARRLGGPITATSANPSGAAPALSIADARGYFGDRIAVYLDHGPVAAPVASTVVRVTDDGQLRVLRAGAVLLPEDGGTR